MSALSTKPPVPSAQPLPGWDALLLALLVFSLLMITGFAESGLGNRFQDVARHPWLGQLLPQAGVEAMGQIGPRPAEPLGLLLFATTLGLLGLYFVVDLLGTTRWQWFAKGLLLTAILLTAVYLPTGKLILLDAQGPRGSYSHDGGVLQTEATIAFFLQGKNPYVEDYTQTPMATWGHPDFRTALYHYPYLPWTFIFSAPFYGLGQALGFYDQRLVYLLLFSLALVMVPRLATSPRAKLALTAAIGLNPLMALDLIFGQNDVFVLCWLLFSLVAWQQWRRRPTARWALILSALCFGLACASKPTAWFFAPFYGLLLLVDQASALTGHWRAWGKLWTPLWQRGQWALVAFALLVGPYLLWDPFAFYDDVWRWSNGQGETGYQIWGWGASNFVLAFGWVQTRFAEWPFWRLELLLAAPLLLWFLQRQRHQNTLFAACWHYGVFLFVFFYSSRFLNENYLSYILAFLSLGILTRDEL
ncbi:MAG: DUF2029 domain-containing protein [Caldilineaceae bacterium]|nr:DUF2029 domain-containing protein [Caldilineaceae bacterium]